MEKPKADMSDSGQNLSSPERFFGVLRRKKWPALAYQEPRVGGRTRGSVFSMCERVEAGDSNDSQSREEGRAR